MVFPHFFFTVNFTNASHGCAWSQASCSYPQHELLLLLPSPGHCSQTSYREGPYNSCSKKTWTPAHDTKLSLTLVQELAAIQGPQQPLGSWFG